MAKEFSKKQNQLRLFEKDRLNEGDRSKTSRTNPHHPVDWNLKAQHSNERPHSKECAISITSTAGFPLVHGNKNPEQTAWPLPSHNYQARRAFRITLSRNKPMNSTTQSQRDNTRSILTINPLFGAKKQDNTQIQQSNSNIDNIDLACPNVRRRWATTQQQSQKIRTIQQLLS